MTLAARNITAQLRFSLAVERHDVLLLARSAPPQSTMVNAETQSRISHLYVASQALIAAGIGKG
ncbi:hypothetical protein NXC14_PA00118 (plasmid) [Rhizobium sp. NXC14]|nr:hypothetical protein NXC14_PA00118 [Rhizobium sp. NXC14]